MHRTPRRAVTGLLAVPLLAIAWPPLYNREHPRILGVPFFYAYQLLVVALALVCMVAVHRYRRGRGDEGRGEGRRGN